MYCFSPENIESVIINGKFTIKNKMHMNADRDDIISELQLRGNLLREKTGVSV
ncbi:hypothetical protein [endosymbiont 'TC1' of Trimyema compressum]|uniref:hypothetical protein n=1 Tax=endosymbiont 'TC1' of Trimyema compressum TaxID=243899 RepID=UPI0013923E00|nr:hypothetical protein [endosymbiont 'TC1' of Trimyema compressum]